MSSVPGRTQTEEREEQRADRARSTTRLIRFFRADDPFDDVASFLLPRHATCQLGRTDGRVSASTPGHVWTNGDALMSRHHAALSETYAGWQISDLASKNGTWVNGRRISAPHVLRHGDIVECGRSFFLFRQTTLHESLEAHLPLGASLDVPPFYYQIAPLCPHIGSDVSIHLHGETGTGKEIIARALHSLSKREGSFVAINCAAIPETLFESEMFGFKKGAFSGATEDHRGAILAADHGTLFLDEIGELSRPMQAKLLRVLELKEVTRVGTSQPVPSDFRLISASLCNLKTMVARGRFRRDLYARLGQTFTVPPLRNHKEELGHFIQSCLTSILTHARDAHRPSPKIHLTLAAARALVHYNWPCNIREVKRCIDHAFVSALSEVSSESGACRIDLRHLPSELSSAGPESYETSNADHAAAGPEAIVTKEEGPSDLEIAEALREAHGNRQRAATLLGITERTVYRRLKKLREASPSDDVSDLTPRTECD